MNRGKTQERLGRMADIAINEFLDGRRFKYVGHYNPDLPENEVYTLQIIPQKGTLFVSRLLNNKFSSDIPIKDLNEFQEIL